MPRYLMKADKIKKVRLSSHCKKHCSISLYKNKQKCNVQKAVSGPLTDGVFVIQNNELVKLSAQFAAKLKVSPNVRTMTWKHTKNHKISTSENRVQAASNFLQDNMRDFMKHGDMLQISSSPKLKNTKTTNQLNVVQCKNIYMKDKKEDSTLMTSIDNRWKTKNLIINQVGYMYRKFVSHLTDVLLFLLTQIFYIIHITI